MRVVYKTTLYIPEQDLLTLKALALKSPRKQLTYHIQQAIKRYLADAEKGAGSTHRRFLQCRGIAKKCFGDAVDYQRKLRQEWE